MHTLAFEDIETHGRFQVTKIRFNAPSRQEKFSEVRKALEGRVDKGRYPGNGLDAKACLLNLVA